MQIQSLRYPQSIGAGRHLTLLALEIKWHASLISAKRPRHGTSVECLINSSDMLAGKRGLIPSPFVKALQPPFGFQADHQENAPMVVCPGFTGSFVMWVLHCWNEQVAGVADLPQIVISMFV